MMLALRKPPKSAIAVFINGTNTRLEVLRYSAKARNAKTAQLTLEALKYDLVYY
jgi:hypothetical protein